MLQRSHDFKQSSNGLPHLNHLLSDYQPFAGIIDGAGFESIQKHSCADIRLPFDLLRASIKLSILSSLYLSAEHVVNTQLHH